MRKGWIMDIASISMAMSQSTALTKVGTAVLSNAMDTNEALGQGLVEMIDAAAMARSVNPHIGSIFDMLVSFHKKGRFLTETAFFIFMMFFQLVFFFNFI